MPPLALANSRLRCGAQAHPKLRDALRICTTITSKNLKTLRVGRLKKVASDGQILLGAHPSVFKLTPIGRFSCLQCTGSLCNCGPTVKDKSSCLWEVSLETCPDGFGAGGGLPSKNDVHRPGKQLAHEQAWPALGGAKAAGHQQLEDQWMGEQTGDMSVGVAHIVTIENFFDSDGRNGSLSDGSRLAKAELEVLCASLGSLAAGSTISCKTKKGNRRSFDVEFASHAAAQLAAAGLNAVGPTATGQPPLAASAHTVRSTAASARIPNSSESLHRAPHRTCQTVPPAADHIAIVKHFGAPSDYVSQAKLGELADLCGTFAPLATGKEITWKSRGNSKNKSKREHRYFVEFASPAAAEFAGESTAHSLMPMHGESMACSCALYAESPRSCELTAMPSSVAGLNAVGPIIAGHPVRDPTTWTILQHDGPNHLALL